MRHLLQHLNDGTIEVAEAPIGPPPPRHLQVRLRHSVISSGTEGMLQAFGDASWIGKAMQHPDRVRQVIEKVKSQGVLAAAEAVQARLQAPILPGYSASGDVIAVGDDVGAYAPGVRVALSAPHAEVVHVPVTLCAPIPAGVGYDAAAFSSLAAVALHGVRCARPTLGEHFLVVGLGLLGQITAQLLRAHGCRVTGIEPLDERARVALELGIEHVCAPQEWEPLRAQVDGAIVCAHTSTSDPLVDAITSCRRKGRVVLVGVADISIDRSLLYERECTLLVSSSLGPGRYERAYAHDGHDLEPHHVRWTAGRNIEACLEQMRRGTLRVTPLVEARRRLEDAGEAYALLGATRRPLAIMLDYDVEDEGRVERTTIETGSVAALHVERMGWGSE